MVPRALALVAVLSLAGCSVTPAGGAVSFVLNQQASDKGNPTPGKSYDLPAATLRFEERDRTRHLVITAGNGTGGTLSIDADAGSATGTDQVTGKLLPIMAGSIAVAGKSLLLDGGTVILQAVTGTLGRGNFNARVKDQQPPWEAVGNFEALIR